MNKYFKKSLCICLSAIMIMQILPMTVWANDLQSKTVLETTELSEVDYENLSIIEEVVEERDEFSKTYLLENNIYCQISSVTPLHEEINNKWEELNPISNDHKTIEAASSEIANQSIDNSKALEDADLNDGLVNRVPQNLDIYGASFTENESDGYVCNITNEYGTISETSFVLVKPKVFSYEPEYNKTEVTVDASIELVCNSQEPDLSDKATIQVFNSNWEDDIPTEDLMEFNNVGRFANVNEQIYDYNSINSAGNYVWNITAAYCQWEKGTLENNGLIISGSQEIYVTGGTLIRYYRIIDENDNGFTYHSEDMGRAGTLYINDYTNVPTLIRNEFAIDESKTPFSLERSINRGLKSGPFGAGGRWNWESDLTYSGDTFIWNMPDGSSKRFQKSQSNEKDSLGREKWVEYLYNKGDCELWVESSSLNSTPYQFNNCIICDENENIYKFNTKNKLISITSKNNDTIRISYDSGNKITNITDFAGRQYVFDNSGFVAPYNYVKNISVKTLEGEPVSYDGETSLDIDYEYVVKNGRLCLSSATYADGKTVYYEYDDYGRLNVIKNIDNSKIEIEYSNDNPTKSSNLAYFSRMKSYTKLIYDSKSKIYVKENTVEFDSDDIYRRVIKTTVKNDVITETSQYNTNLDLLYITDSDGNEYYATYDDNHGLTSFFAGTDKAENLISNGDMNNNKLGTNLPAKWLLNNLNSKNCRLIPYDNNDPIDKYVQYDSSEDQVRYLYQNISFDIKEEKYGKKGDKYLLSAQGKAKATIPQDERFWGVRILAKNSSNVYESICDMAFDASLWDAKQERKVVFSLPFDTNSVTVQLISCNQLDYVEFDNIFLCKCDDAYVADVDDNESACKCPDCTEPDCPCRCSDEQSCNCIFCKRGIKTETNSDGSEITKTTDGVNTISTRTEFSSSGNYPSSSTDENGATTHYTYDEENGTLSSVAAGNANDKTNYSYNAVGYLNGVSQTVTNAISGNPVTMTSSYTYDGDTLESINHNGTVYNYDYDMYGNVTKVKVGDNSLSEYSYNYNGNINSLTYGNGDKILYTYDDENRITSISTMKAGETADSLIEYEYEYATEEGFPEIIEGVTFTSKAIDNVTGDYVLFTKDGDYVKFHDGYDSEYKLNNFAQSGRTDFTYNYVKGIPFYSSDSKAYNIENGITTNEKNIYLFDSTDDNEYINFKSQSTKDYFDRSLSDTASIDVVNAQSLESIEENNITYKVNNTYSYPTNPDGTTSKAVSSIKKHYKFRFWSRLRN